LCGPSECEHAGIIPFLAAACPDILLGCRFGAAFWDAFYVRQPGLRARRLL
jgi:hypothetical protein